MECVGPIFPSWRCRWPGSALLAVLRGSVTRRPRPVAWCRLGVRRHHLGGVTSILRGSLPVRILTIASKRSSVPAGSLQHLRGSLGVGLDRRPARRCWCLRAPAWDHHWAGLPSCAGLCRSGQLVDHAVETVIVHGLQHHVHRRSCCRCVGAPRQQRINGQDHVAASGMTVRTAPRLRGRNRQRGPGTFGQTARSARCPRGPLGSSQSSLASFSLAFMPPSAMLGFAGEPRGRLDVPRLPDRPRPRLETCWRCSWGADLVGLGAL